MAKKKKAAATGDRLPNRKYVVVGVSADAAVASSTTFDTMMGAREGAGWMISRLDVQSQALIDGWVVTTSGIRFQLCTGAQTTLLTLDDDEVIATLDVQAAIVTEGMTVVQMPITWVGPVLVASRQLSCTVQASDNSAPFTSQEWVFTVWYQWVKLGAREWVEIAEARGIA